MPKTVSKKTEVTKVTKVTKVSFSKENGTKASTARSTTLSVADRKEKGHSSNNEAKPTAAKATGGLTVQAFDMTGKAAGTVTLPKEVFGQTPNQNLLTQAIKVYSSNAIKKTANTKTRSEVRGGGKKPWRQKGTGRARAGSSRSPLWVGGGITFGPRTKDVRLQLPQKMRHKALIYALSQKAQQNQIKVIVNIEKIPAKTKPVAQLLSKLQINKNVLLVISEKNQNLKLATRNIQNLQVNTPNNLNAFEVLKIKELLLSKESIEKFK